MLVLLKGGVSLPIYYFPTERILHDRPIVMPKSLESLIVSQILLLLIPLSQQQVSAKNPTLSILDTKSEKVWFSEPLKCQISNEFSTNGRHSLYMDFLCPVYYSRDRSTLFFFDSKKTYHNPWAEELNLGIGLRKIVSNDYIIGANLFYDKKFSTNDKYHYQLGYGLEYLSKLFDFRFNYYDPTSGTRMIDDSEYGFGELGLVNQRRLEEPLEGFDLEFGFPLPKQLSTRFYIGGFNFDSDLADDVRGLRLRSETQIVKGFSLDLTLNSYENDETHFIAGVRVSLPFDFSSLFKGGNIFKPTFKKRDYLQERLFERVVRDIDIQSRRLRQEHTARDMIYVDNRNDFDPLEDGSFSHPHNTLGEAFANPRYKENVTIYTHKGDGTSTGYSDGCTLADGVTLWGSGYNGGYSGIPTTDVGPLREGKVAINNDNTVMGFRITNCPYSGIAPIDSHTKVGGTINILNNTIENTEWRGIYLNLSSSDNTVNIRNNTLANNDREGIHIEENNSRSNINITGNSLSGPHQYSQRALYIESYGSESTITVSNNTFTDARQAIDILADHQQSLILVFPPPERPSIVNLTLQGNQSTYNGDNYRGISLVALNGSTINATTNSNTLTGRDNSTGTAFSISYDTSSDIITNFYNNTFQNARYGVYLDDNVTENEADFGGGLLGSPGYNRFINCATDIKIDTSSSEIKAENNWWGSSTPSPVFDITGGGSIDYEPYLTSDPQ
jgi:hypothetical protein